MSDPVPFSIFKSLPPEEQSLLVSLPYRVGYWISQSDQRGGKEASHAEMVALETIVISFIEDFCKSEFVEGLMGRTMKAKSEWPSWQAGIEKLPQECQAALASLRPYLDRDTFESFKHNLFDIALNVAQAYQEDESASFRDKFIYWKSCLAARLKRQPLPDFESIRRISVQEAKALVKLASILEIRPDRNILFRAA